MESEASIVVAHFPEGAEARDRLLFGDFEDDIRGCEISALESLDQFVFLEGRIVNRRRANIEKELRSRRKIDGAPQSALATDTVELENEFVFFRGGKERNRRMKGRPFRPSSQRFVAENGLAFDFYDRLVNRVDAMVQNRFE